MNLVIKQELAQKLLDFILKSNANVQLGVELVDGLRSLKPVVVEKPKDEDKDIVKKEE